MNDTANESSNWSRTTRWVVAIIILIILVWLFIVALPLVEATFIGALLAYILDPLVRFIIRRTRMRRSFSAAIVFSLVLLLLLSLPAALGALAYGQFRNFGVNLNNAIQELQAWLSQPINLMGFQILPQSIFDDLGQAIGGVFTFIPGGSFNILSGLTTNLLWGLVIVFSLYYFLKDGPKIKPWLVSVLPADYQPDASRLLDEVDETWAVFLRVQLLIFFVLAILLAAGSYLVVVLYRLGLIPYSWIGLVAMLLIVYALVQQVDNLWLRPQLLGHRLRLHPAIVVIGLIGALALSGILGALVVVPMIASAKVVGNYLHNKLLGLPPWPPPAEPESAEEAAAEWSQDDEQDSLTDSGNRVQIR